MFGGLSRRGVARPQGVDHRAAAQRRDGVAARRQRTVPRVERFRRSRVSGARRQTAVGHASHHRKALSFSRPAARLTIAAGKRWATNRFNPWRCSSRCRCCNARWKRFSATTRRAPGCATFPRSTDAALNSLMERVHEELMRRHASATFSARHRAGHRHPSGAKLCRNGR